MYAVRVHFSFTIIECVPPPDNTSIISDTTYLTMFTINKINNKDVNVSKITLIVVR